MTRAATTATVAALCAAAVMLGVRAQRGVNTASMDGKDVCDLNNDKRINFREGDFKQSVAYKVPMKLDHNQNGYTGPTHTGVFKVECLEDFRTKLDYNAPPQQPAATILCKMDNGLVQLTMPPASELECRYCRYDDVVNKLTRNMGTHADGRDRMDTLNMQEFKQELDDKNVAMRALGAQFCIKCAPGYYMPEGGRVDDTCAGVTIECHPPDHKLGVYQAVKTGTVKVVLKNDNPNAVCQEDKCDLAQVRAETVSKTGLNAAYLELFDHTNVLPADGTFTGTHDFKVRCVGAPDVIRHRVDGPVDDLPDVKIKCTNAKVALDNLTPFIVNDYECHIGCKDSAEVSAALAFAKEEHLLLSAHPSDSKLVNCIDETTRTLKCDAGTLRLTAKRGPKVAATTTNAPVAGTGTTTTDAGATTTDASAGGTESEPAVEEEVKWAFCRPINPVLSTGLAKNVHDSFKADGACTAAVRELADRGIASDKNIAVPHGNGMQLECAPDATTRDGLEAVPEHLFTLSDGKFNNDWHSTPGRLLPNKVDSAKTIVTLRCVHGIFVYATPVRCATKEELQEVNDGVVDAVGALHAALLPLLLAAALAL